MKNISSYSTQTTSQMGISKFLKSSPIPWGLSRFALASPAIHFDADPSTPVENFDIDLATLDFHLPVQDSEIPSKSHYAPVTIESIIIPTKLTSVPTRLSNQVVGATTSVIANGLMSHVALASDNPPSYCSELYLRIFISVNQCIYLNFYYFCIFTL